MVEWFYCEQNKPKLTKWLNSLKCAYLIIINKNKFHCAAQHRRSEKTGQWYVGWVNAALFH